MIYDKDKNNVPNRMMKDNVDVMLNDIQPDEATMEESDTIDSVIVPNEKGQNVGKLDGVLQRRLHFSTVKRNTKRSQSAKRKEQLPKIIPTRKGPLVDVSGSKQQSGQKSERGRPALSKRKRRLPKLIVGSNSPLADVVKNATHKKKARKVKQWFVNFGQDGKAK